MKLLVLDGNSILNRAFYGIKLLTTKSGEFTNGIVGFLNILEKVKDETEPDAVAIAFDMKAPTFRHKAYAGYKAQRKGMPPELAAQMPVLKELLGDLGYKIVTCEGWEADDILGTFAETCHHSRIRCGRVARAGGALCTVAFKRRRACPRRRIRTDRCRSGNLRLPR